MCGIVGYTGRSPAVPKLIEGLERLEYRGYDSAGISVLCDDGIKTVKRSGRVQNLKEIIQNMPLESAVCGIGHTRWATHGKPSDKNAHPHTTDSLTLVHNGIIENFRELKSELSLSPVSDTDTEVAALVITEEYKRSREPISAIYSAISRMTGTFAFCIMFRDIPNVIYVVRRGSPLILGEAEDGNYIASDMTALLPFTNSFASLSENCIAEISGDGVRLVSDNGEIGSAVFHITDISASAAEKGGYSHFMLKEFHEQPTAVMNAVHPRIKNGLPDFTGDGLDDEILGNAEKIYIVACGSAMHAGLIGKYFTEKNARIPVTVEIASEFRYNEPLIDKNTLVIVVSQSGETADSLASLRYAKEKGAKTVGIVNVVGSAISAEADTTIYTNAGPEIAVATTKGYTTQCAVLILLSYKLALIGGTSEESTVRRDLEAFVNEIPAAFEINTGLQKEIRDAAELLVDTENLFYIGRGVDSCLCQEGSLKLKEISYIHSEAYPAGELKHGTISLITRGMPVIALSTEEHLADKTLSNIHECATRGAYTVLITTSRAVRPHANTVIKLPQLSPLSELFSAIAVMQLLAYETALRRGCDIDKPRNLAKSVTVE